MAAEKSRPDWAIAGIEKRGLANNNKGAMTRDFSIPFISSEGPHA